MTFDETTRSRPHGAAHKTGLPAEGERRRTPGAGNPPAPPVSLTRGTPDRLTRRDARRRPPGSGRGCAPPEGGDSSLGPRSSWMGRRSEYAAGPHHIEALKGREFTIRLANPDARARRRGPVGRRAQRRGRGSDERSATKGSGPTRRRRSDGRSPARLPQVLLHRHPRSYARFLGDTANVGTIEAVFFREKPRPPIAASKDRAAQSREGAETRARPRLQPRRSRGQGGAGAVRRGPPEGRVATPRSRRHRNRPRDARGPVGGVRGGPAPGGARRDSLRASRAAGPAGRPPARGRPLGPGKRERVRSSLRSRSVRTPLTRTLRVGSAVESRRRPTRGAIRH